MPLIPSIAAGSSAAAVKHAILSSISFNEGAAAIAHIDTWDELDAAFNLRAINYGTNKLLPFEGGASARAKINAMLVGAGLSQDLDLYYDAVAGKAVANQAVITPANLVSDIHPQSILVPNGSGGWVSRAVDVLCDSPLGLQTVPTFTQHIPNVSTMIGGGWTNGANAAVSPFLAPDGTPAIRLTDNSAAAYQANGITITLGADTLTRYISVYIRKTVGTVATFGINLTFQGPGSGLAAISARFDPTTGARTSGVLLPCDDPNWWRWGFEFTNNNSGYTSFLMNYYPAARPDYGSADNVSAQGSADIWAPNVTTHTNPTGTGYQAPTYSTGLLSGNLPKITGLTALLATGVCGYIKFNQINDTAQIRCISFNDGLETNHAVYIYRSVNNWVLRVIAGGVEQANFTIGPWSAGQQTIVFAASPNFVQGRKVGQTAVAADTSATYPTGLSQLGIGGRGFDASTNIYQLTQKLGLKFGAHNQASFDTMYALAAAA